MKKDSDEGTFSLITRKGSEERWASLFFIASPGLPTTVITLVGDRKEDQKRKETSSVIGAEDAKALLNVLLSHRGLTSLQWLYS